MKIWKNHHTVGSIFKRQFRVKLDRANALLVRLEPDEVVASHGNPNRFRIVSLLYRFKTKGG